ncbi:MAG: SLC13 family permease [Spirochaetales bacterium]|nr:SLC13 family permease [Spirochaetales bacterium]
MPEVNTLKDKGVSNNVLSRKNMIWLLISVVVYAVIRIIPIADLSPEGHKALAILGWIIVVLISNCLPTMVTNLVFALLIILTGVLNTGQFLIAVATSPLFMLICLSVVAMGMSKTNLGARIAYWTIKTIGRTPSLLVLAVMLFGTIISALIVNLPALLALCPVLISILTELNQEPGKSKLGKALFLGLAWSGGTGGLALISSNVLNAASVGALSAATDGGAVISYGSWAIVGIPVALVLVIPGWLVISRWFRVNKSVENYDPAIADKKLEEMGPVSFDEIKYFVIIVLMILCFFFSKQLKVNVPIISFIFMTIMIFPKIGLIDFDEASKKLNWAMIFQVGFFVGFAGAIANTGLGNWLTGIFSSWLGSGSLIGMLIMVTVIGHIATFVVPGGGATIMMIPTAIALAAATGLNPTVLAFMFIITCQWSQFQPVQPQYLIVCSNAGGFLEVKDVVIPNIIISFVWTIFAILVVYIFAPMAGML